MDALARKKQEILIKHEGFVDHMYLDSRGYVTVGVGCLLAKNNSGFGINFYDPVTKKPSSKKDIKKEWTRIKTMPTGYKASWYSDKATLRILEEEGERILTDKIREFEHLLHKEFKGYGDYPEKAQIGLLDMIYTLGASGLTKKFPLFCEHVKNGDWIMAAVESNRHGVSDARNEKTCDLFANVAFEKAPDR